jgi:hypothetical protein
MIILPSGRQLQRYKNNTPQMPGIHFDMLWWMSDPAQQVKLPHLQDWYFAVDHIWQDRMVVNKKTRMEFLANYRICMILSRWLNDGK